MDDRRFDQLVKAVASGASRRSVLKGMLGLGGAALVGSAALDADVDAARRPTPTPKPPTLSWAADSGGTGNVSASCPKAPGPYKCGPDCCTGQVTDAYPRPAGHSECCDNACCFGTCYGEELCCPTNPRSWGAVATAGRVLSATNECCLRPTSAAPSTVVAALSAGAGTTTTISVARLKTSVPAAIPAPTSAAPITRPVAAAGTNANTSASNCPAAVAASPATAARSRRAPAGANATTTNARACPATKARSAARASASAAVRVSGAVLSIRTSAATWKPTGLSAASAWLLRAIAATRDNNAAVESQFVCRSELLRRRPRCSVLRRKHVLRGREVRGRGGRAALGEHCLWHRMLSRRALRCQRRDRSPACCDEGFLACSGGICCRADVYQCATTGPGCECTAGTEACGLLPGGCCPDGQCNDLLRRMLCDRHRALWSGLLSRRAL